jgi:hypothetical protein
LLRVVILSDGSKSARFVQLRQIASLSLRATHDERESNHR